MKTPTAAIKTPGQIAYEAFGATREWEQSPPDFKVRWENAAQAVLSYQGALKDELLHEVRDAITEVIGGLSTKEELAAMREILERTDRPSARLVAILQKIG